MDYLKSDHNPHEQQLLALHQVRSFKRKTKKISVENVHYLQTDTVFRSDKNKIISHTFHIYHLSDCNRIPVHWFHYAIQLLPVVLLRKTNKNVGVTFLVKWSFVSHRISDLELRISVTDVQLQIKNFGFG